MSEEPIRSEEPTTGPDGDRPSRRARLIMTTAILLAVAAVIVIVVLLVSRGDESDDADGSGIGTGIGNTDITSPYDVHELPADTDLGEVESATLVSISLVGPNGELEYYGLSSDTEPAKALIKAVKDADELQAPGATTTDASGDAQATVQTITFLLPDRGTLMFVLDVDEGTVSRSGQVWQVDGDLAELLDAAVTYQQQQ